MSVQLILAALAPGDLITLSDINENDVATDPADASLDITFDSDGHIYKTEGVVGPTSIGTWITPQINMANYSIKMTTISGTPTSGTVGSFLSLASDRTWNVSQTSPGTKTWTATVDIVLTSNTGVVLDTCTLTMVANVL